MSKDVTHTNARLIAAAPDLLKSLKAMLALDYSHHIVWGGAEARRDAFDAIAKAEGRDDT